jgi:excisionase family DNA binding protein
VDNNGTPAILLTIDPIALRPVIELVVTEVLGRLTPENKKEIFSETEAAEFIGVKRHVLRDLRLRGGIAASQIVGKRLRYRRSDLDSYLEKQKYQNSKA